MDFFKQSPPEERLRDLAALKDSDLRSRPNGALIRRIERGVVIPEAVQISTTYNKRTGEETKWLLIPSNPDSREIPRTVEFARRENFK